MLNKLANLLWKNIIFLKKNFVHLILKKNREDFIIMKNRKITGILTFFILLFAVNVSFGEIIIKAGGDFSSEFEYTNEANVTDSNDIESGAFVSGEYIKMVNDNIGLGLGIAYQMERKYEDFDAAFNFAPLYGIVKVRAGLKVADPYLIGQAGYSMFFANDDITDNNDLTGGLYYGLGCGIIINNMFQIEILQSVFTGIAKSKSSSVEYTIDYSTTTASIGIIF